MVWITLSYTKHKQLTKFLCKKISAILGYVWTTSWTTWPWTRKLSWTLSKLSCWVDICILLGKIYWTQDIASQPYTVPYYRNLRFVLWKWKYNPIWWSKEGKPGLPQQGSNICYIESCKIILHTSRQFLAIYAHLINDKLTSTAWKILLFVYPISSVHVKHKCPEVWLTLSVSI